MCIVTLKFNQGLFTKIGERPNEMKRRISLLLTMLVMLCGNIWATGDDPDETKISTVAEVKAGAKGETYRVRGVCEEIANRNIGYWTLRDYTGYLYIVGTRSKEGDYNGGSPFCNPIS